MMTTVVMASTLGVAVSDCTLSRGLKFDQGDVFTWKWSDSPDTCCAFCCGKVPGSDSFTFNAGTRDCTCKTYSAASPLPDTLSTSARCPDMQEDIDEVPVASPVAEAAGCDGNCCFTLPAAEGIHAAIDLAVTGNPDSCCKPAQEIIACIGDGSTYVQCMAKAVAHIGPEVKQCVADQQKLTTRSIGVQARINGGTCDTDQGCTECHVEQESVTLQANIFGAPDCCSDLICEPAPRLVPQKACQGHLASFSEPICYETTTTVHPSHSNLTQFGSMFEGLSELLPVMTGSAGKGTVVV